MESKFYLSIFDGDIISAACVNEEIDIYVSSGRISITTYPDFISNCNFYKKIGYKEVTRQEFMDFYVEVQKDINNKIKEL